MDSSKKLYEDAAAPPPTAVDAPATEPIVEAPGLCKKMKRLRWSLVLIFLIGFVATTPSSVIPTLQQNTYGNQSYVIAGAFSSAKGAAMMVYTPMIGAISDRVGRPKTLTAVLAISIVPYAIYAATQNFWAYSFANCYLGLFDPALSLVMASIVDSEGPRLVGTPGVRTDGMTESFALGSSIFFFGLSLAPFLGAFLDFEITFITCAVLQTLTALACWRFLSRQDAPPATPEVAVVEGTPESPTTPKSVLASPSSIGRIYESLRRFKQLRWTIAVISCNAVAEQLLDRFLLLYLQNSLNFGTTKTAIIIAVLGVGGIFGMLFMTRLLVRRFGNLGALRVALASNVLICILYAVLPWAWPIIGVTALSVIGMGVFPCACALATRCSQEGDAGVTQGMAQGARMIASAVTPFGFGYLFQATENTALPGASFLVGAFFVLLSLVMTRYIDLEAMDEQVALGVPILDQPSDAIQNGTSAAHAV